MTVQSVPTEDDEVILIRERTKSYLKKEKKQKKITELNGLFMAHLNSSCRAKSEVVGRNEF